VSLLRLRGRYLKVIFILFFILTINSLYATTDSLIQKELAQKALRLNNDGVKAYRRGDYLSAINYTIKSLEIREKIFDKYDTAIAISCNNLGRFYSTIAEYNKALFYLERSLSIRKKSDKVGKHLAVVYNNIGIVYQKMGQYPKALKAYEESLNLRKKIFGIDSPKTAIAYNSIGNLYELIEDYSRALKYYKKDLLISETRLGKEHIQTAIIYNDLGLLYKKMKDFNSSLFFYKKSLKIHEKKFGLKHSSTAISYNNLGVTYMSMNKFDKALEYYKKALKAINSKYYLARANIYNNIGVIYFKQKLYSLSLEYYNKALDIEKKIFSATHTNIEGSYNNIALVYKAMRDYEKAYYYFGLSFDTFVINRDNFFAILDSKQKNSYLKINRNRVNSLLDTTHLYISKYNHNRKNILVNNLNRWLKYKGTIFENQNLLSMIEKNPKTNTKTKQNIKELKKLTIQLDNLDNSDIKPKNYKEQKSKIEEQIHDIEVNLSQQNPRFQEQLDLQKISYQDISTQLKSNQLYIDFARGVDNYYIFTLDNRDNISFEQIDSNLTKSIDSNITEFLEINREIAENINNHKLIESLKPKTNRVLLNLYTSLIGQNIKEKKASELIISPDGKLNFLPFEALFNGKKYLLEDCTISYISSGREFIRQSKRKNNNTDSSKVVIFGTPNYEYGLEDKAKGGLITSLSNIDDFEPIDSSKEIEIIERYYNNVEVYKGANATIENLMSITNPKILHISTHGFFFNDENITNPMRRSALALTSANDAMFQNNLKGIATALKLSSMELYGTELVVLSACETALGTAHNAEGVLGLPKAFIQAGAKKVIMSLWSVSEKGTALLMEKFYTHVHQGESYPLALRDAKLEMIKRHPYYWSAFIMSGI